MRNLTDIQLAAIIAASTLLGALASVLVGGWLLSADTQRETDVQLVEIAVGVLSEKLEKGERGFSDGQKALRAWSVETINDAAKIQITGDAKSSLINGSVRLVYTPKPRRFDNSITLFGNKKRLSKSTVTQRGKPWEHNPDKNTAPTVPDNSP